MRVVHVPRRFVREAWGGTETVVLELAKRQLARGDDARVVTSMALAGSSCDTIEETSDYLVKKGEKVEEKDKETEIPEKK